MTMVAPSLLFEFYNLICMFFSCPLPRTPYVQVCIKVNTKFEKLWNNKNKEQVLLNLTSQYGIQKYFFIRKFNEIDLCEIIT